MLLTILIRRRDFFLCFELEIVWRWTFWREFNETHTDSFEFFLLKNWFIARFCSIWLHYQMCENRSSARFSIKSTPNPLKYSRKKCNSFIKFMRLIARFSLSKDRKREQKRKSQEGTNKQPFFSTPSSALFLLGFQCFHIDAFSVWQWVGFGFSLTYISCTKNS